MKRASLSVRPPAHKIEPADLTDRLLDRETEKPAGPASPDPLPRPVPASNKRGRGQVRGAELDGGQADAKGESTPAAAIPPEPEAPPPVLEASITDENASLEAVLRQAAGTAEALETAARQAPARYDVALRYRLDALAHHLRQVADFVANLARR